MGLKVSTPTILVSSNTPMPRPSGRVVIQPYRFMYLGESFEEIIEEHEIYPTDYDEAIINDDTILWHGVMEPKLESMYSDGV